MVMTLRFTLQANENIGGKSYTSCVNDKNVVNCKHLLYFCLFIAPVTW